MRWLALALAGLVAAAPAATVNLAWDAVPDARVTGYEVGYGSAPGAYSAYQPAPGTTTTLSVPDSGATHIAVRALGVDSGQPIQSGWSNEVVWLGDLAEGTRPLAPVGLWARIEGGAIMADPAFGALSTRYYSGGTAVSSGQVTLTNVAVGDLVLVTVQRVLYSDITGVTLGSQALTELKANDADQADFQFAVWGAIATSAGAGSSVTITASFSSAATWLAVSAARWTGVASATPLTSSCNSSGCLGLPTAAQTRQAQSITTAKRALIVAAGTDWNYYPTHTAQNSYTKRLDNDIAGGGSSTTQFLFDRVADAGTFGGTETISTTPSTPADEYLMMLLAFEASDQGGASAVLPAIAYHRTQHGMQ